MKAILTSALVFAACATLSISARAEEKTLKGEAMCAKCELKEAKSCQAAIRVKEGDKTETYYATQNQVAKDFHKNICTKTAKVVAKGDVKEVEGKKQITLSKIELVEK